MREHTCDVVAKVCVCVCVFFAVSSGMSGGGGWGFTGMQQPQQPPAMATPVQNYEAMFKSLFPINGMVTGGWGLSSHATPIYLEYGEVLLSEIFLAHTVHVCVQ